MGKRLMILFVVFFYADNFLFAQMETDIAGKKNLFYVKSIINQLNVGYCRSIIPAISLSFECGYQFSYLNDLHYTGSVFPLQYIYRNLAYSGVSVRLSPNFKISELWTISPLIGYQDLYAKKIIDDPGSFAGDSDASYSEYSQRIDEMIAQMLFFKQIQDIPIQYYFGIGIRFQHLHNSYSVEGSVDHKEPSDRKEKSTIITFPSIIIGLKFLFVWF